MHGGKGFLVDPWCCSDATLWGWDGAEHLSSVGQHRVLWIFPCSVLPCGDAELDMMRLQPVVSMGMGNGVWLLGLYVQRESSMGKDRLDEQGGLRVGMGQLCWHDDLNCSFSGKKKC